MIPTLIPRGMIETSETGAIYRMSVSDETQPDQLPALDAEDLIRRPQREPESTETTLRGEPAIHQLAGHALRLGAFFGVLSAPNAFEPTPFSIAPTHAAILAVAAPAPIASTEPAAYKAFKDLAAWLEAEDSQIADMVGIGRTTPYAWKREGHEPRAATAQRIYEHHATLDSLSRRLGAAGLHRWLREASPTRRDTLLNGDLESLERDVHTILFRRSRERRYDLAAAPDDYAPSDAVSDSAAPSQTIRPSGRRPRRPAQ